MAEGVYRAGKGRGRGGFDSDAAERLRQRRLDEEQVKAAPRLPSEDDSAQTNLLLGNGAVKVPRCGKCTRPLDAEAVKGQQFMCTKCTGGKQGGSSAGDKDSKAGKGAVDAKEAKGGKSGRGGKGGKDSSKKSSPSHDAWASHAWDDGWGEDAWAAQAWDQGWGDAWADSSWSSWDDSSRGQSKGKGSESRGAPVQETRFDPSDGKIYTFEDIMSFYKGEFTRKEILLYWDNNCEVLRSGGKGAHKGSQKETPKGKGARKEAASGKGSRKGSKGKSDALDDARPSRAKSSRQADDITPEKEEVRASKPRFYVANFKSTEEIASSMTEGGWRSKDVGDANHHESILVPGGRKVNALCHSGSGDVAALPSGLRARVEELGELLKELVLMGGEGDFPGFAFALLPGEEDVQVALMDALGVRKAARFEVTLDETSWENDFTEQQLESSAGESLSKATELLKAFGSTSELNFSEFVPCAPVVYFAQSTCSEDRPVLGVIHGRLWK